MLKTRLFTEKEKVVGENASISTLT